MHRFAVPLLASVVLLTACPADSPVPHDTDTGTNDAGYDVGTDMPAVASMTLTEVDPSSGPASGGTDVTLTGSGFMEGMTVRFGSGAVVDATVKSDTSATATTPASPASGAVTVVVRNTDGGTASLQGGFTYAGQMQMPTIGFCQLQAQSPVAATTGVASDGIYAIVYVEGVTNGAGQGSGVEGELGWGADDMYMGYNFTPMTYNTDKDGLNPGDMANDEYGAGLTVPMAGTYHYVARFRISGSMDWTYCDLDGGDVSADQLGELDVTDPATPTVGFCRTDTTTARVQTNSATAPIQGTVFAAGQTVGAGAAPNITGEIVWGPSNSDPTTWTDTATATYSSDADGLNAGDMANDVWTGTITPTAAGDYGFYYRFSADGGTTWLNCDTDGATGASDFDTGSLGALQVQDMLVDLPDACNLQFPQVVENGQVGQAIDFYGRVTKAGVTGMGQADPNVVGQLLIGPTGADPSADISQFQTIATTFNTNTIGLGAGEDEYTASFTPSTAADYAYAFRFSVDGGNNWSYCGLKDPVAPSGTFAADKMGWLAAASGTPDTIDFCHVWQTTLMDSSGAANPPVATVEVFEDPTTVGNNGANSAMIEAQAATLGLEVNPALSSATWNPISYKGLRVGYPNNYEYEGPIYAAADRPSPGDYDVVIRVRKTGTSTWTYCDTDDQSNAFRLDAATRLTVAP